MGSSVDSGGVGVQAVENNLHHVAPAELYGFFPIRQMRGNAETLSKCFEECMIVES